MSLEDSFRKMAETMEGWGKALRDFDQVQFEAQCTEEQLELLREVEDIASNHSNDRVQ